MIYFDYSATTPVSKEVINEFINNFNKNENIEEEKEKIKKILNTNKEIIYTSGSTESNNIAIKKIALKYKNQGYHIITTELEHSSINETLKYLEKQGFIVDYVKLNNGIVDIENLKSLINEKTILVSISSVNSEIGLLQPIEKIGLLLKEYPNIVFHCDMTQSIGKININLENIDLISFSSHKIYGMKGIGILLKNKDISLKQILYGTRTYNYGLVKSLTKALEISIKDTNNNYKKVKQLNEYLKEKLKKYKNIHINSTNNCIPHILNISIDNYKPETFLHFLEMNDIYISTKSACSKAGEHSKAVYALTQDIKKASTSVRISLSYKNNFQDIDKLISIIEKGVV